jgi:hypothetical protein
MAICLSKIAIYLSLGLYEGRLSYRRSLQPLKNKIKHFKFQNMIYLLCFLSLWVILPTWIRSIRPKSMRIRIHNFGLRFDTYFFVSAVPAVLLSLSPQHQNLRLTFESRPRSSFSSFSSSKQPQLLEKNPRKSTLVTVTCLCVYVCIPAHKTDKYRVTCEGERAGERERRR